MISTKTVHAIILTAGSELLRGSVANTNGRFLAELMDKHSFPVRRHVTVHDRRSDMLQALRAAERDADIVLLTGGLGPTFDDITVEVLAEHVGRPLTVSSFLRRRYGRLVQKNTQRTDRILDRLARIPAGARLLNNRIGMASGFVIRGAHARFAVMPGVPSEMEEMAAVELMPVLNKLFPARPRFLHYTFHTKGISENRVVARLKKSWLSDPRWHWGIYPKVGEVELRLYYRQRDRNTAKRIYHETSWRLRRDLYAARDTTLCEVVGGLLLGKRKTLAVAESLTGGSFGALITDIPGASSYFLGGVTAYANDIKERMLGVPRAVLKKHGAVSAPVARAMARGVRKATRAHFGFSLTGIAGPGGGSKAKPVGLVYMALSSAKRTRHYKHILSGPRARIRQAASVYALSHLFDELSGRS